MHFAAFAAAVLAVAAPGDAPNSDAVNSAATVLLDFRADWCGPCRSMDPVVGALAGEGLPVRRVNIDQERALADKFGVQGIPCFVMLVNGKEVDRVVGATDRGRLEAMFSRNGVGAQVNNARAQSPSLGSQAKSIPFPAANRPSRNASRDVDDSLDAPRLDNSVRSRGSDRAPKTDDMLARADANPPARGSLPTTGAEAMHDKLIRASVRLKIEDATGNSVGSGTIVDARDGEALIITCGHVFRDAVKGGQIRVDLFGPNAPKGVPGHLIDYDLKSEVGVLRIETNYPVAVARMAPAGFKLQKGDDVISIGCDGGADATVKETKVTSVNRYSGAENVEVDFQPVQGRSGGGLFTPDGLVVGVCYAADPEASEGLFAALPALCSELEHNGLSFVCRSPNDLSAVGSRRAVARGADQSDVASILKSQVASPERQSATGAATPASDGRLPANEQAALDAIRSKAKGAELICIVHPEGDPQGKSEIFVLDHVSQNFMHQLAAERSKNTQQLTSLEVPRSVAKIDETQPAKRAVKLAPPDTSRWWADVIDR
jgi:thiol-disulfide isomerase/thioredoxin